MKKDSSNIEIQQKSTCTSLYIDGKEYLSIYSYTADDIQNLIDNNKNATNTRRIRLNHPISAIVKQGGIKMDVNGKTINICGRSMFYCTTGAVIDLLQITPDTQLQMMSLSHEAMMTSYNKFNIYVNIVKMSGAYGVKPLEDIRYEHFTSLYDEWLHAMSIKDFNYKYYFSTSFIDIFSLGIVSLFHLHIEPTANLASKQEKIFNDFIKLLNKHANREREVQFYADKLGITPKYLSTITIEYSNTNASKWIEEYVMTLIVSLMCEKCYRISDIAEMLNFPTQSFFGRYFKRITGMSPRQYMLTQL